MRFIFTVTCTPADDDSDLDLETVRRFGNMLDIAAQGAGSDCRLKAELVPITVLP